MIEEILGIERGHMADTEVEIEVIEEDLMEKEVGKIQDPEVEEDHWYYATGYCIPMQAIYNGSNHIFCYQK